MSLMNAKSFWLLMVVTAIVVGVLCTYASAYVTCENAYSKMDRARIKLVEECDALAEMVTPVSALALQASLANTNMAERARLAKERMLEHRSVADMARAFAVLRSAMQTLVLSLDGAAKADVMPQYPEYRRALVQQFHRMSITAEAYNETVRVYHKAMDGEVESFWNRLMRYKPVEAFGAVQTPASSARTNSSPRRAVSPSAGSEPPW